MKKELNNKGFSLVELIIVIAIMAVLMGVLAPQYLKYVKQSKISTDITNAEEIANAVNIAIADSVNSDADQVAITSGTGFGGGTVVIKYSDGTTKTTAPTPKVDKDDEWKVTFDKNKGVTQITLHDKEIWPTSSAYETEAKTR